MNPSLLWYVIIMGAIFILLWVENVLSDLHKFKVHMKELEQKEKGDQIFDIRKL